MAVEGLDAGTDPPVDPSDGPREKELLLLEAAFSTLGEKEAND